MIGTGITAKDVKPTDPVNVRMGDNSIRVAERTGTIKLLKTDGSHHEVNDTLLVDGLAGGLFSISQILDDSADEVIFTRYHCSVMSNGKCILRGRRVGKLYKMPIASLTSENANSANAETLHLRFGHSSLHPPTVFCTSCKKGKKSRANFSKTRQNRSKHPLDLIVSDVEGPFEAQSRTGNRYAITFTDDASRHTTVYFLKHKSEALQAFQAYKRAIETKTGRKIKALRTDNGGEYTSKEFGEFLDSHGIQHQRTVPHTPQQNGIAERLNRTLVEMSRTTLIHSGLQRTFWQEAMSTAAHVINRIPTKALEKSVSPHEALTGQAPDTAHFRPFGCLVTAKVPDASRRKLDPKATVGILVGYAMNQKGYRILDKGTNTIFTSRDVQFAENSFPERCDVNGERPTDTNNLPPSDIDQRTTSLGPLMRIVLQNGTRNRRRLAGNN